MDRRRSRDTLGFDWARGCHFEPSAMLEGSADGAAHNVGGDLRALARRRSRECSTTIAIPAPGPKAPIGPTRPTSSHQAQATAGVDVRDRTLNTTMTGVPVSMPVALAPTGMTGMLDADGEILAAAPRKAGVPFTLSTMSICSIEDVAESTTSPFWFQLYVMRDRDFTRDLIDRAKAARCSALVLTLDLDPCSAPQGHCEWASAPPRMRSPISSIWRRTRAVRRHACNEAAAFGTSSACQERQRSEVAGDLDE